MGRYLRKPRGNLAEYQSILFPHILTPSFLLQSQLLLLTISLLSVFHISISSSIKTKHSNSTQQLVIISYLFIIAVERILYSTRGNEAIKKLNYHKLKQLFIVEGKYETLGNKANWWFVNFLNIMLEYFLIWQTSFLLIFFFGLVGIITPKFMSLLPHKGSTNFTSNQVILSQLTIKLWFFKHSRN